MADEITESLLKASKERDIDEVLSSIKEEQQLDCLIKATNEAVVQNASEPFQLLFIYLTTHYTNTDIGLLNEAIIDFFQSKPSQLQLAVILEQYPQEKRLSLINRLLSDLDENTLSPLLAHLKQHQHIPLIECLFLSDSRLTPIFEFLPLFSHGALIELLEKLKDQRNTRKDGIQQNKCNAIYYELLNRFTSHPDEVNTLFASEHAQDFLTYFLTTSDASADPSAFFITALKHFSINKRNASFIDKIEAYLLDSIKTLKKEKEWTDILAAYEENRGFDAFNEFLVASLNEVPDTIKFFLPYLKQLEPGKLIAFLSSDPAITEKACEALLNSLEPRYLSFLVIMINDELLENKEKIHSRLNSFIAQKILDTPDFPLDKMLQDVSGIPTCAFLNLISTLFNRFADSAKQSDLIFGLLYCIDVLDDKKQPVINFIKTSVSNLLASKHSGLPLPAFFKSVFTKSESFFPLLFTESLRILGKDEYLMLLEHLLMSVDIANINDALPPFKTDPDFCARFIFSSPLPQDLLQNILQDLNDDNFISLYQTLSLHLDKGQKRPSNFPFLLSFLATKIKETASDSPLMLKIKDSLLSSPNLATALLCEPSTLSTLTALDSLNLGLGLIKRLGTSYYDCLSNSALQVIRSFETPDLSPLEHKKIVRRIAQRLLITNEQTPSTLLSIIYNLTAATKDPRAENERSFVNALKEALFELISPTDTPYTDTSLNTYLAKLNKTPTLMNGVYSSIALDAATETDYALASEQLEKINSEITLLDLSQWDLTFLPAVLLNSDSDSSNWALCANIIKANKDIHAKNCLIHALHDCLDKTTVSHSVKEQIARFIINHLYDEMKLSTEQYELFTDIAKYLPPDFTKENSTHLFLFELIQDLSEKSLLDIKALSSVIKQFFSDGKTKQGELILSALNHPFLTTPYSLGTLFSELTNEPDYNDAFMKYMIDIMALQSDIDKKLFLATALKSDNYKIKSLSFLNKQFTSLNKINRFSLEATSDFDAIISPLFSASTSALQSALDDFSVAPTSTLEKEIIKGIDNLNESLSFILHQNNDWNKALFSIRSYNLLFASLIKLSQSDTHPFKETLIDLLLSLPPSFSSALSDNIEDQLLRDVYFDTITCMLENNEFASTLTPEKYRSFFYLLPDTRKEALAKRVLGTDPLALWQKDYLYDFAGQLNSATLFSLFETQTDKTLLGQLVLHDKESYRELTPEQLNTVLVSVNSNTIMDNLFKTLSPSIVPMLSKAIISHLASDGLAEWLTDINLFDDTFVRFVNGVTAPSQQATLRSIINKKIGLGLSSNLHDKINKVLKQFKGEFIIFKDGLLYDYLKLFISSPVLLSDCAEDTYFHLTKNIDIDYVTQALADNTDFLDDTLFLTHLMQPFVYEAGPIKPLNGTYSNSQHQVFLTIARWYLNLSLIISTRVRGKDLLNDIEIRYDSLETIPEELESWYGKLNKCINSSFTHQNSKERHTNQHYNHIEDLMALLDTGLELIADIQDDKLSSLFFSIKAFKLSIEKTKTQYDNKLMVLDKLGGNLKIPFSIDGNLARMMDHQQIDDFPSGSEEIWLYCLHNGTSELQAQYDTHASGLLKAIDASFNVCEKSTQILPQQKAFIKFALLSSHVVKDEERIKKACSLLKHSDLKEILVSYQEKAQKGKKTLEIFNSLQEYCFENYEVKDLIHFLYTQDIDLATLKSLESVALSAQALPLSSLISLVYESKKIKQPEEAIHQFTIPISTSDGIEDAWFNTDIERTIQSIHLSDNIYQDIYKYGLCYKGRGHINEAITTLDTLGVLQHEALDGKRLAFLLNSYAPAVKLKRKQIENHSEWFSLIDVYHLEKALLGLLNSCDYQKQMEIIQHLDRNMLKQILEDAVLNLSSKDLTRRKEAANLIDYITSYGLRDDVDDRLKDTVRLSLSKDNFNAYHQFLSPIIQHFITEGKTLTLFDDITDEALTTSTFDGIWIQRILLTPEIVQSLTPEQFKELIERYRRLSLFLKKDEYNVYEKWEKKVKEKISELKLLINNEEHRLQTEKTRLNLQHRLTKEEFTRLKEYKSSIALKKKHLSRIEEKKKRLLKFKANDSIRELLRQLQGEIDSLSKIDSGLSKNAERIFSQYLNLELSEYKTATYSRLFNFMHGAFTNEGDLASQTTMLSRLCEKYIPHYNFVTKEQMLKQIEAPIQEGALLYNEKGIPIAVLDEDAFLLPIKSTEKVETIQEELVLDALFETDVSNPTKPVTLLESLSYKIGTPLYNKSKERVGFLDGEGKLSSDNLFLSKTSAEILSYTPLHDLKKIQKVLPLLIQDVLSEGQLPYLYDDIHSPLFSFKDESVSSRKEKPTWLITQIQKVLLSSQTQLDRLTAKNIVSFHSDTQYEALLAHAIKTNKQNALTLIGATLSDIKKVNALLTTDKKKNTLFSNFSSLSLSGIDMLSFVSNQDFCHEKEGELKQFLLAYQLSKDDYLLTLSGHKIKDTLNGDKSTESESQFHDKVKELASRFLTNEMIASLHPDVKIEVALTPKHYPQLNQEQFNTLFEGMDETQITQIYLHFLNKNQLHPFFDKGIILFLRRSPDLFYRLLNTLEPIEKKDAISAVLLTHHEVTDAVFETQKMNLSFTSTPHLSLGGYFGPKTTPFELLFSKSSFMAGLETYSSGYNHSDELAKLLSTIMYARLEAFLKSSPTENEVRLLSALSEDKRFAKLHERFPLCNSLYSQLVEKAAKTELVSLFYDETNRLDVNSARRKIRCSILGDVYAQISETSLKDSSWAFLQKLSWQNITKQTSVIVRRLPWLHNEEETPLTWEEVRQTSWDTLQGIGGEVKAIDLYALNYKGGDAQLKKLLNDYLHTHYEQDKALIPKRICLPLLHSTIRLLNNPHVSNQVKAIVFQVFEDHKRLRDKTIINEMAKYNLAKLLKFHGKRKEYDIIIDLHNQNHELAQSYPVLKRANTEAVLEKQLQNLTGWGWVVNIKRWWSRVTQYGWHGFFKPNLPQYVAPFTTVIDSASLAPMEKSTSKPFSQTLADNMTTDTFNTSIEEIISDINNPLTSFPVSRSLLLLKQIPTYRFSTQTSIDEEINSRQSLNSFFSLIQQQAKSPSSLTLDESQQLQLSKEESPKNRLRLVELYTFKEAAGSHTVSSELTKLYKECRRDTEHSPINRHILNDMASSVEITLLDKQYPRECNENDVSFEKKGPFEVEFT